MRISDWSSDVCSSDLAAARHGSRAGAARSKNPSPRRARGAPSCPGGNWSPPHGARRGRTRKEPGGSRSTPPSRGDRKRVEKGKRVSVRVDLGGRRYVKKIKKA